MSNENSIMTGIRELPQHLNLKTISSGLLAGIFGITGPAVIIIGGASEAGLTQAQTISWIFSVYFFGALIGLFLSLKYRQPIIGAWSIPGAVLVAAALQNYSLAEAVGAYFIAGVIVFVLGISGVIGKIMYWLPAPIIMAMIAGAMIRFGTGMITSLQSATLVAGSAILAYLVSSRLTKKFPPILSALLVSVTIAAFMGLFQMGDMAPTFVGPQFFTPAFSVGAILSIAIPLAILVIGAENAQASGVLMSQGYKPPINSMTIWSGVGGMATAFFGGHNANIAGPMTAICASEESGKKLSGRYASVIVNFIVFGGFGLLAGIAVPFVIAMPGALVGTVAGLAMIGVLLSSLQAAFSKSRFQIGAFFSLIIAMSGISFFGISSPFWAIIGGVIVSLIIEGKDFEQSRTGGETTTKATA
ncbi:benzoate membrane transport protein [Evansella vedderi]|uniref:Benzoate membrane transport protein n=1 Tax=Evansella vedderi TaxID=38282 RepID=A0ABT9ZT74_9BACI|nr:benzoate/H(+) symporter BenE family transporter [Evansella vedderi]MDQ0253375.1 benzoate membrane transport protein [Evansella vedderi]